MELKVLGDYVIVKKIGQGSLGSVFLAEHRFMKKQVVLKLLPEELSSDRGFIQRFEEEVAVLSSLDHPNIVKIHNISFDQGQYFLVTDCIVDALSETTNLGQYIAGKEEELEEEKIYRILSQIAEALDYAHKKGGGKGIVHRGLKLNNILVGGVKNDITVYLSDFGLSKIVGPASILTRTYKTCAELLGIHSLIYTSKSENEKYPVAPIDPSKLSSLHLSFLQNYLFLAPEQKKIDYAFPVDSKADVYAFGVLAYYLLTKEFPEGIFPMPSKLRNQTQWDWDTLIQSCLHFDPASRPDHLSSLFTTKIAGQPKSHFSKEQDDILRPILHNPQIERPNPDLDPAAAFIVDSTVKHYVPERKEIRHIQPLLGEMSVVKGGNFHRGSQDGNRDEMPRHQVTLKSFAIDIHPITNEQFVCFLEVMGGEKDNNHNDIIRLRESRIKRSGGKLSIESGYAKHPVVGVTWYGAIAYAKWVGKRLPTEAEWEIASRGGLENALYPTGDEIEKTEGNFFSSDTTAVMSYAPNEYGLYDMAGNVYEWCQDWYGYNYYEISIQEPENPTGPLQGVYRVLRGGCWKSLKEDLRCSRRHRNNPGTVNGTYGFRCAADVE